MFDPFFILFSHFLCSKDRSIDYKGKGKLTVIKLLEEWDAASQNPSAPSSTTHGGKVAAPPAATLATPKFTPSQNYRTDFKPRALMVNQKRNEILV